MTLKTPRLQSIDIIRGAIMILMVIDHVRVYSGQPPGGPSPGIFITRWVTHFCVTVFVFFAGTAIFLHAQKPGITRRSLSGFLLIRGLLLVLFELTWVRFSWTFNLDYANFTLGGVIWMLGLCMMLMAALVWLPTLAIGITGLVIAFGQDLLRLVKPGWLMDFLYYGGKEVFGINILYSVVPWIGVMAAGYGFGTLMLREPAIRRKICLWLGLSAIALFLIAGSIIALNQSPGPDGPLPPFWQRLLNQRKYPASQLYLLMTLGPTIALIPWAERARGWFIRILAVFGRVPMFYYLLHTPIIHIVALLVNVIRTGSTQQHPYYDSAPYTWLPEEHRWSLPLLYLVVVICVALLYYPCKWFARVKAGQQKKWLSYI